MKDLLNHKLVKWALPLLGSVGGAGLLGLTHPVTLSFVVGGVLLNVVLGFGKKK